MIFAEVPLDQAEGAVLAHSVMDGGGRLRKGVVLGAGELAQLRAAGVARVMVARLEPGDVDEDSAATRLAQALVPDPVAAGLTLTKAFTGRVNLNAVGPGLVELDAAAIHALNAVDPSITLATLAPFTRVEPGTLAGTVKIISYAVSESGLARACDLARAAIRVRPVVLPDASLILTEVPGLPDKLASKGRAAVAARLRALGMQLRECVTVPHEEVAIANALGASAGAMVLILTGSATSDLHDTAPQALRRAGGQVARFGMPVDPGNLLFHGQLGSRPVIGLPGCARSPALNGADWVLERLACGLVLTDAEIAAMGVGGLLKEIPIRPHPRERG
ncbi:molybdopterin-binding protein [Pseudotabrizicola alkalilacus]|uniref:Molybdopterin biosynthesis protein n=1 Tax=Pseudotabrizicola alkalilacus TaxID=2305252 RepID=A0A411Z498_9RHOB|nr:molybdopterin-binding protein [Pseudotabrizicola alkalilacus]RGP37891.1 molybdopterin biosynthesis protein [Pseudotabrizicola alkalilacus]